MKPKYKIGDQVAYSKKGDLKHMRMAVLEGGGWSEDKEWSYRVPFGAGSSIFILESDIRFVVGINEEWRDVSKDKNFRVRTA